MIDATALQARVETLEKELVSKDEYVKRVQMETSDACLKFGARFAKRLRALKLALGEAHLNLTRICEAAGKEVNPDWTLMLGDWSRLLAVDDTQGVADGG